MPRRDNNDLFAGLRESSLPCGRQQCPICPTPGLADVPASNVTRIESQHKRGKFRCRPSGHHSDETFDPNAEGAWQSSKYERRADSEWCERLRNNRQNGR
jgi:hypothetical protein